MSTNQTAAKMPCAHCEGRGFITTEEILPGVIGEIAQQLFGGKLAGVTRGCSKCGGTGKVTSNADLIFTQTDKDTIREALTHAQKDFRHLIECRDCRATLSDTEFAMCVRKRDEAQAALDALALAIEKGKL